MSGQAVPAPLVPPAESLWGAKTALAASDLQLPEADGGPPAAKQAAGLCEVHDRYSAGIHPARVRHRRAPSRLTRNAHAKGRLSWASGTGGHILYCLGRCTAQEYLAATVAFRPIGLDLCGPVLAPCLLGCAGTGRQGPALTPLCLAALRYSSARHSIPVTQVF